MIWISFMLLFLLVLAIVQRRRISSLTGAGSGAIAVLAVGVLVTAGLSALVAIPAGHVGVPVLFGKVQPGYLPEGLNLVNPLVKVRTLSVRTETYTMSALSGEGDVQGDDAIVALSSDGLRMPLDITVAYRLVGSDAPWVFRNLGEHYVDKIVRPASRTAVREATSKFTSQEAYATKREELAGVMQVVLGERIESILGEYEDFQGQAFVIQQVMLRNVDLPGKVKGAIEDKLAAEQEALRMQFVLEKELQEAERKRIEGRGIADFQQIVSEGISEPLLRWKGIEATMEIARSENSKVIVIGSGDGGLPIILNPE